jgi:hypothetical protein
VTGRRSAFVVLALKSGIDEGLPIVAARRTAPVVDDSPRRQVGRTGRRGDNVTAGGTGIRPLLWRATSLIRPSGPTTFKLSVKMHGIDEDVHGTGSAYSAGARTALSHQVPIWCDE